MNNNLDLLLGKIQEIADVMERVYAQNDDLRYGCIQSLVLDYGKPFTNRITPSPFRGKVKQCYKNCFERLLSHGDYHYCEGYAIDDDIPLAVAHAWLVDDDGQVIDPTWSDKASGATYFGVVFEPKYVFEIAREIKCYGILENDYMNGHKLMTEGFPPHALHPQFHGVTVGE